jgi:hypothetical protein
LRLLQLIQILGINAETLAEQLFPSANAPLVNWRQAVARREKGGVRITEAAFEGWKTGVLARFRFTAR